MIKLCLITPFENLGESKINGDMHFALTRQLKENEEYYKFFKQVKKEGGYIIVDNNIHEGDEISFEEHVTIAIELGNEIVIPDVLRNKKRTLEYYHYFMDKFYDRLKKANMKIMGVPQGETMCEIQECFEEFNNDDRIDVIGNSFDLVPQNYHEEKYKNQSWNRMMIIDKWLRTARKPIHMLGSNNLWEMYFLSPFMNIRSTDGKIFSRLALANIKLDMKNWVDIQKPTEVKMNFSDKFTKTQKEIYIKNVQFFKERLRESDTHK